LWATEFIRQFGWEWAGIAQHDLGDEKAVGAFDKRRSPAVSPFEFVFCTLESRSCPTISLAFKFAACP
jgi:hypothetical protein